MSPFSTISKYSAENLKVLKAILEQNADTAFGRKYGFGGIETYADYRGALPPGRYEDIEAYIQRTLAGENNLLTSDEIIALCKTSGTTSESKYIPLTRRFLTKNHHFGGKMSYFHLLRHFGPNQRIMGVGLSLTGYSYDEDFPVQVIDISALMVQEMPWVFRWMNFPNKIFTTWEEKLNYLTENLEELKKIRLVAGVPTWVLSLFSKLSERTGKPVPEIFSSLTAYIHGGVNFEPYARTFERIFPDRNLVLQEVYNATEGYFAFQASPADQGLTLLTDAEIFYEFVPKMSDGQFDFENAVTLGGLDTGAEYLMLITTSNGLYRFVLGDLVTFTSLDPPQLLITGREKEYINAFGEDLGMFHVSRAFTELQKKIPFEITQFTVHPVYPKLGQPGCHRWLIEFTHDPENLEAFRIALDDALQTVSNNYRQKRNGNLALRCLEVETLPKGSFARFISRKRKIGGQVKIKRLSNDEVLANELLRHISTPV